MAKKIDAEKLIKAIEEKGLDCSFALKMERLDTLALIDSLQQEQPEVDLEKGLADYCHRYYNYDYPKQAEKGTGSPVMPHIIEAAKYFYELGKNSK